MTETTTRLRWESLSNGDALGYVTPGQWLYEICKPSDDADDDDELELRSRLPGQTGDRWQGNDRDELEREAEEMLAQFVTSLGAIFPDCSAVTRFETIDHTRGLASISQVSTRAVVAYGASVKLSFQDDGQTLKVFLTDPAKTATAGEE